ncbi:hypothetical protein [Halopelagius longus]|uniref:Uncharacterized protein n=1 Tax=Halopelagius longus TaxID=1236180 RepID=A0A1H1D709_9EURY|nr:hypothetical protein [Halopelagius longus]RDI71198.1 hypothetical protein DWB78_05320 [Halopelagius longus]SDQ72200.1 hypothetical protein SAMN05216278_2259 [Halopelagius longus]
MADTRQTAIRAILVGYLALLIVAIVTGNPLANVAVNVGFGVVALYFGYTVYEEQSRGIDPRVRLATAGAFVLAGLAQFVAVATRAPEADIASSALFVLGFIGYLVIQRV